MPSKKSTNSKSGSSFMQSRTVNVSADGGPPQAMTPEAAARYLQQATTNSNNREVKISFGPSRPPSSSNRNSASANTNNASAMSFGSLDLQALKETAAAAAAAQRGGVAPDGLPCSEAEMKALMGMFVEIMGMSMDGGGGGGGKPGSNAKSGPNGSNSSSNNNRKNAPPNPMFMFGNQSPDGSSTAPWPDQESLAAATAGFFADGASWDAIRRTYGAVYNGSDAFSNDYDDEDDDDDDDDENESIPELDDMCDMIDHEGQPSTSAKTAIAPGDWASLEKVAVEDALEEEDRARRAAKKREKKQRRKQKQKEEAAVKAAEAAEKKREKTILSWRSRVVSASQAGELPKLEALLQESPLNGKSSDNDEDFKESALIPHLEFLLPNSIAKSRTHLERGKEARHRLADYILSLELSLAFVHLRSGRTALHTACFQGDLPFVELVLDHLNKILEETRSRSSVNGALRLSREDLNETCSDSGWTPLHYAALSGSTEMLEALLRAGCNVHAVTNDTHTWRDSDGYGVTPRELIEYIRAGTYEQVLESHGVALQEMQNDFFGNDDDRRTFMRTLEKATKRLKDVEINGYIAPGLLEQSNSFASDDGAGADNEGETDATGSKKRKKKKKKKKSAGKDSEASKDTAETSNSTASVPLSAAKEEPEEEAFEDPLVTALLGMGFAKEQILAAVEACGGTNRATADDLVTWILGQDADGSAVEEITSGAQSGDHQNSIEVNETTVLKTGVADEDTVASEENRQKQETARRLAEKREEQRRRNREWNNREQARQQQHAKAKLVQSMAPSVSGPPAAIPPGYGVPFPQIQGAGEVGLQAGLPGDIPSAANSLQTGYSAQPSVGATHQFSNPHIALKNMTTANPSPAVIPTVTSPVPLKATRITGIERDFPALSQSSSASVNYAPPVAAAPPMTSHNSFPPIGDDERTVSSFGSNRGLSVSSAPFLLPGIAPAPAMAAALAPPGFMKPASHGMGSHSVGPPLAEEEMESGSVQSGEIRATAREFVPKGYTPPPVAQPQITASMANARPSISSSYGPRLGAPLTSSLPEAIPPFHRGSIPFSQGFLGNSGPPPPTFFGGGPIAYDRMPTVTPVSEDTSVSIGSSMTGIPGLDDSTLSSGIGPLGFGMEQQSHTGSTASLLSSTFVNQPSLGSESIWGGTASTNAAPSLSGLPPLNFSGDSGLNYEEDDSNNAHLPRSWGASGGGLSGAQGGSIW